MNKVILIGNIVKDFEAQKTSNGISFARFNLAVARPYTKDGQRETDFLSIIVWRDIAENCAKFLKKGSKIAVVGSIQTRSYEINGEKKYATEINAETVEFLSSKKGSEHVDVQPELTPIDDDNLPF